MTADELLIARSFRAVKFGMAGTRTHKLAMNLCLMAENRPTSNLTNKQHAAMLRIATRFRRQIAPETLALVAKLKAQLEQSA